MKCGVCASVAEQELDPPQHGSSAPNSLHDARYEGPVHGVIGIGNVQDHRCSQELGSATKAEPSSSVAKMLSPISCPCIHAV
jgi:hypothetical protein